MNISPDNIQPLMMMAGIGLICWLLLRGKLKNRKRHASPLFSTSLKYNSNTKSPHSGFTGTESLGAPAEVLKWQVELHDLGRELKAELDSKLIAVRTVTNSYEQAARRLSQLIQMAEQVAVKPPNLLVEARRLSAQGWTTEKIAEALGLSAVETEQLLDQQHVIG